MPSIEQSPGIFQLSKRHLTLECNDDTQSTDKHTSYKSYPPQKPFINNPPIDRCSSPSAAFPENINQGIMNAISKLHEKMLSLEGDRVKSTRHVKSLHNETNVYNTIVQDEMNHETPGDFTCTLINQSAALAPPTALSPPTDSTRVHNPTREHCFTPPLNSTSVDDVTFGTTEVHKRLQCAEEQAFDLEKALSGMRTMLNDRSDHKFPDYRSAGVLSAPSPASAPAPTGQRLLNNIRDVKYKLKKQDLSWCNY